MTNDLLIVKHLCEFRRQKVISSLKFQTLHPRCTALHAAAMHGSAEALRSLLLYTRNPKSETWNPKPQTPNPKPEPDTRNPKPETETRNPKRKADTRNWEAGGGHGPRPLSLSLSLALSLSRWLALSMRAQAVGSDAMR